MLAQIGVKRIPCRSSASSVLSIMSLRRPGGEMLAIGLAQRADPRVAVLLIDAAGSYGAAGHPNPSWPSEPPLDLVMSAAYHDRVKLRCSGDPRGDGVLNGKDVLDVTKSRRSDRDRGCCCRPRQPWPRRCMASGMSRGTGTAMASCPATARPSRSKTDEARHPSRVWWYGGPRFYRGRWNGGGFGPCWTQTPIGNVWNCGR